MSTRQWTAMALAAFAVGCGGSDEDLSMGNMLGEDARTTSSDVTAGICPGASTVQGVDVSVYQGSVNWAAVKSSGRQFAIARISDGVSYPDSYFASNWAGMKNAGLIRGAYQFFRPNQDAVAQANMVVQKIGKLGPNDLPAMLDMEVTGSMTPAQITAKIHQWVDTVQAGTGKAPLIYTGAYFWDDYVKSTDFNGLALNVAWYGTNCPGVPQAWAGKGWRFHQYTSSASVAGISGNVDADVFNGTLAQLQAYAGGSNGGGGNVLKNELAAIRNKDGRLEVFWIGAGNAIYHKWEQTSGGWSASTALGGLAKEIAVGQDLDGRIEIFYVGTNDAIYQNWQTSPGGSWFGEYATNGSGKSLAVGKNLDGRLELFAIGGNDALYHRYQTSPNGSWSPWATLGGSARQMAVASNKDGRLQLFYIGTNDALYENHQTAANGGWAGEGSMNGIGDEFAVEANADGRLEVFVVGTDSKLYHAWQGTPGGAFSAWAVLGGLAKKVVAGRNQDGRIEVFYIGTNDALYHNWQQTSGGWYGEAALGGLAEQLFLGQNADGRLELVYGGTNEVLYHNWQTAPNGGWAGEANFGGTITAP